jgi:hypothetical protein
MALMLGADGGYLYFAWTTMGPWDQMNVISITTLLYKLIILVTGLTYPGMLGRAACAMGPLALAPRLTVSRKALVWMLIPVPMHLMGVMLIHAQAVAENPMWAIPISICGCTNFLAFCGMVIMFYAWIVDFLQTARAIGANCGTENGTTVKEAVAAAMHQFEHLKVAIGDLAFCTLLMAQVIQIFSLYNIFTGNNRHSHLPKAELGKNLVQS